MFRNALHGDVDTRSIRELIVLTSFRGLDSAFASGLANRGFLFIVLPRLSLSVSLLLAESIEGLAERSGDIVRVM